MSVKQLPNNLYGFTSPLTTSPFNPIISKRAPTTSDFAPLGATWIYTTSNLAYILTSIVSNSATWLLIESASGAGVFASLTVTPGPISFTGTTGITGATTIIGTTSINATGTASTTIGNVTGAVSLLAGAAGVSISAAATVASGYVSASTFYATGDASGAALTTALTNVTVAAGGTGAFVIHASTGAGTTASAGFLKFYVGATAVYIPYWTQTT